jgi:hypothetical protein
VHSRSHALSEGGAISVFDCNQMYGLHQLHTVLTKFYTYPVISVVAATLHVVGICHSSRFKVDHVENLRMRRQDVLNSIDTRRTC